MNRKAHRRLQAVSLLAGLLLSGAVAPSAFALPLAEQHAGAVTYVTGGIGDEEDAAIKGMMHDYSVSMTFAKREGGKAVYLSDVPISVRDEHGDTVLRIKTNGPYLLIKLPAGRYSAEASHDGTIQTRNFTVAGQRGESVVFEWS